jgi:DNA-binding MarR family transcriptional regulator
MHPPSLPASLGPVLEFMRGLWALDHALFSRARVLGKRFGITGTQRLAIRIVGQTPGVSAGAVARVLHVHPSTLTPVLQQLEERGLLRRGADPLDRRRAILCLTKRGERIDTACSAEVDEHVRRALAQLAPSEVFHARRVIDAVATSLGKEQVTERRAPRRAAAKASVRRLVPRTATPAAAAPPSTRGRSTAR